MMTSMTSIAQTPITGLDLTGFAEREPGVWTDAAGLRLPGSAGPVPHGFFRRSRAG